MNYRLILFLSISVKTMFCPSNLEGLTFQERRQLEELEERRVAQIIAQMQRRYSPRYNPLLTDKQLAEQQRICRTRSAQHRRLTRQEQNDLIARLSNFKGLSKK